jgi:hypothetical protein
MKPKLLCTYSNTYMEKVATMTFFRNRMFLEGIALGGICGIIIGSIIAFTLGESSVEALRRIVQERFSGTPKVPFQYLSQ